MEKLEHTEMRNTGLKDAVHQSGKARVVDPHAAEKLEEQRIADRKLVRGIFRYHETPNGEIGFSFRKYKNDPVEHYVLKDGETYTIPIGVAKHLNAHGSCDYPTYEYKNDEAGRPVVSLRQRIRRMSFQNLDFDAPVMKKPSKVDPYKSALPS